MTAAITALDMFALGTHLRGVLGIDDLEQDTSLLRFVADKLAKLVESPATYAVALRLAKPDPFADALKVLQGRYHARCLWPSQRVA